MIRTMLFLHARPGRGSDVLHVVERESVLAVAREQPGFLGVEVATSVADEDDVVIVGFWSSVELYERWRAGPAPSRLAEQLEGLLTADPIDSVYHVVETVG